MQAEKETFRDFLRRTDALAARIGRNLNDMPELIGMSRASFFAYRAGKRPITRKAWERLAYAELKTVANEADAFAAKHGKNPKSEQAIFTEVLSSKLASIKIEESAENSINVDAESVRRWIKLLRSIADEMEEKLPTEKGV